MEKSKWFAATELGKLNIMSNFILITLLGNHADCVKSQVWHLHYFYVWLSFCRVNSKSNSPVKNKQPSPTCLVYLRQNYENQVPSLLPSLLVFLVVFYRILLKFVFSFLVAQFHSWNFSFYTYAEYFAHLCMRKIFCRKRGVKESNQPHTHNSKIPQPFSELKSYLGETFIIFSE